MGQRRWLTHRQPDGLAVCELALYNYIEMRSLVTHRSFLLQRKLLHVLAHLFPRYFTPLYTMVAFSRMRYSEAQAAWRRQMRVLQLTSWLVLATLSVCVGVLGWRWMRRGGI